MEVLEIGKSQASYKSFPQHQHGCWEILLFTEGTGHIYIEDQEWECRPGSLFVLPPYTPHRTASREGMKDMSMFIQDFRPIGGASFRCFQDDPEGSVAAILEMAWHFSRDGSLYAKSAVNVMGDLIYQLCVCYYNQTLTRDLRLEGILELMQLHVGDPDFDLACAIQKTGYHEGYFRRIFKETTGLPPAAYLKKLRMEYARSLFQQFGSSRTVKDVAAACGYRDALYFSRSFRQYTGMSPSRYQAQCVQSGENRNLAPVVLNTPGEYWQNH